MKASGANSSTPSMRFLRWKRLVHERGAIDTARNRTTGGSSAPLNSRDAILEVNVAASVYRTKSGLAEGGQGTRGFKLVITPTRQCMIILSNLESLSA